MKTFKIIIVAITAMILSFQTVNAQSDKYQRTIGIKTQTVKVYGICDMDKHRIEKSALTVDGIKSATWDIESQTLTLTYRLFKKEAIDNVQRKIAAVGNDTEKYIADDMMYQKLPECCHYQRKQL